MSSPTGGHDELARLAQGGDTAALDRLLELIDADGSIRIPVRKIIVNAQTVDDVCQDVLIVVAERIDRWDGRSRFTTWLYTVARNKAIGHLRADRTRDRLPDVQISDQQRVSSLIATRVVVNEALAQLPERYRDPVVLRDVDQHDYDEIARLLGLEPATVRARVSRGRAMVAARLARSNR